MTSQVPKPTTGDPTADQTEAGVPLYDWHDHAGRRQRIFDHMQDAVTKSFPQSYGGVRLELHDVNYADPPHYSPERVQEALAQDEFLGRRLRGTYRLYDEATNQLLDEKKATVMKVPYWTDQGTLIHGGSDWALIHQARLLPGAYTRRKASGEYETHVNSRRRTGPSFRVRLEPESGLFKMDIGQTSLRLYSLLKDLGHPEEELEKTWGPELLKKNQDAYDSRVFEKAYQRLVRPVDPNATKEQKIEAIKAALENTKVSRSVLKSTLPSVLK